MAIIKQFDKRSGITYVYDSKSFYQDSFRYETLQYKKAGRVNFEEGTITKVYPDGRLEAMKFDVYDDFDYSRYFGDYSKRFFSEMKRSRPMRRE